MLTTNCAVTCHAVLISAPSLLFLSEMFGPNGAATMGADPFAMATKFGLGAEIQSPSGLSRALSTENISCVTVNCIPHINISN